MNAGLHRRTGHTLSFIVLVLIVFAGCATAPTESTVIRTVFDMPANHAGFSNLLVISVAGDYESRALFERNLAASFVDGPARATAYYTVIGRQPHLTRTALETAILSRRYDAVLLTRLKGQEIESLVANRPVGRSFDLFGYDYTELNLASPIQQAAAITFVTELYSTENKRKIWAIDTLSFDKSTATELINEQAFTVAAQLRKDGILAP